MNDKNQTPQPTNEQPVPFPEVTYTTEQLAEMGYENPELNPSHERNVENRLIAQEGLPTRDKLTKDGYNPDTYYKGHLDRVRARQKAEAAGTTEADIPSDQALRDAATLVRAAGFKRPQVSRSGVVMLPSEADDILDRRDAGVHGNR